MRSKNHRLQAVLFEETRRFRSCILAMKKQVERDHQDMALYMNKEFVRLEDGFKRREEEHESLIALKD